ncbi:MAG TPA: MgtC/SapB family protein [Phycisphaerae bacterium]|jgi:putative Mg2+ transporter-C (MgtC) family protein
MPVTLDWKDISLRLLLTMLAGLVIGFNRGEHGRPAGMRTTLLVCLAASLSMIQANLLLSTAGTLPDSFVVLDLMRLPLGVLSGMGFIGAGTILRKGNLVQGVTTAATLWFVTLMGLCFGGGQIGLGLTALGLGWLTLWGLKYVEVLMRRDVRGTLIVGTGPGGPADQEIQNLIGNAGCTIVSWGVTYTRDPDHREINCEIQWRTQPGNTLPPPMIATLRANPTVTTLCWQPQGVSNDAVPQQSKPPVSPSHP